MWETLLIVVGTVAVTLSLSILIRNLVSPERNLDYRLHELALDDPTFERCMAHLLGPPLVDGNRVTGLSNGDEIFPAMLAAIRSAQKTITFETFIYWSGEVGKEFAASLAERATSGVRVHVLLDWVGSNRLDATEIAKLRAAGVEVERYRPLRWYSLSKMNNRTHRKILVIDGRLGFIGGVGIADQWSGNAQSPEHWRDSHYQVEGPVVAHLQAAFADNWMKTHADVFNSDVYFPHLDTAGDVRGQIFKSSPREGGDSARLMFHCKLMVIDDCWVSVGSTNFDIRSFRLNDEANLNVIDTDFANQQAEMFAADKNASRQVTLTDWRQRPWSERGIECFANLFKSQV